MYGNVFSKGLLVVPLRLLFGFCFRDNVMNPKLFRQAFITE